MKIIDMLNKIANGEEVPKRILLFEDEIWEYNKDYNCYQRPYGSCSNIWDNTNFNILNEEIEILEEIPIEEDKKIDKLDLKKAYPECEDTRFEEVQYKINEIIEVINGRDN